VGSTAVSFGWNGGKEGISQQSLFFSLSLSPSPSLSLSLPLCLHICLHLCPPCVPPRLLPTVFVSSFFFSRVLFVARLSLQSSSLRLVGAGRRHL
jgi:hypothetical protein